MSGCGCENLAVYPRPEAVGEVEYPCDCTGKDAYESLWHDGDCLTESGLIVSYLVFDLAGGWYLVLLCIRSSRLGARAFPVSRRYSVPVCRDD